MNTMEITVKAIITEHGVPAVVFVGPYKRLWKSYSSISAARRAVKTTWKDPKKIYEFWTNNP